MDFLKTMQSGLYLTPVPLLWDNNFRLVLGSCSVLRNVFLRWNNLKAFDISLFDFFWWGDVGILQ